MLKSVVALTAALCAGPVMSVSASAGTVLTEPRVVAHLDLAAGQQPENITLEPDGSADVSFAFARQIARISPQGKVRVLATLPAPPAGSSTPLVEKPFLGGIVRAEGGTLYFLYSTGSADLTGVWRLRPGGRPHRIAALPADSMANGLALAGGRLYATDTAKGTIWRVGLRGGTPTAWSTAPELAPVTGFGVNGIKVHGHAVWVTNFDRQSLLRIPLGRHGAPGPVRVVATGLGGVDDLAFTGQGDDVLVAANPSSEVVLVRPDGTHSTVLSGADGLRNPTSIARRGRTVYVASAAFFTATDPNLLTARLHG